MDIGSYHTEKTKQKLRESHEPKHHTEETKRKIGDSIKLRGPRRGWHLSKEARHNIGEARKGHLTSEETRRKIGKANSIKLKGHKISKKTRQKISEGNKGKIISKETREKLRESLIGHKASEKSRQRMSESRRGKYGGENAPNWRGGRSSLQERIKGSYEYRQWRSDVFTRDDFTCQECGEIGGKLNAHHKKSFSSILQKYEITTLEEALNCEELFNINNGITHCEECHKKTNNFGGRSCSNENAIQS